MADDSDEPRNRDGTGERPDIDESDGERKTNPEGFDREMKTVDWDQVYERQVARAGIVDRLADLLDLEPGETVLDVGSGPGYTAMRLSERVSPGTVIAIDRRRAALAYLCDRLESEPEPNRGDVKPLVSDATTLGIRPTEPVATLLAFVLHHVDDPAAVVRELETTLPADSRLLVTEYDPDAPGEFGPPIEYRHSSDQVVSWLERSGFDVRQAVEHPEEKFSILARRLPDENH